MADLARIALVYRDFRFLTFLERHGEERGRFAGLVEVEYNVQK